MIFYAERLSVTLITPKLEDQASVFITPGARKAQI
jgi:hypothetical protein